MPTDIGSPLNGAGNGGGHRDGDEAGANAPNGDGSNDDKVATPPQAAFQWTSTGITCSLDGLTIDADNAMPNQYGRKALINVRWADRLCYRQRMNLDDPDQRELFVRKLQLACRQVGTPEGTESMTVIAARVTPAFLIELSEACRRRLAKPPTDPQAEQALRKAAEQRAGPLLDDPAVLSRVGEAMRANGYAGKLEPAKLAYVALTSRLLEERPISLALVADPAAGKNATIDAALALVPPEAVYVFTASSPTALVYTDEDFQHRVVIFKEADSIPDRGSAAAAIRALAEDNVLRYEVTIPSPSTGTFETRRIEKAGPTGLITTSTRPLSPQLHTRLLPVPVDADELTTFQVILAKGERAGRKLSAVDVEPFLAFQRWLAVAGERRVTVPFGWALARAMSTCSLDLRMRRDFESLIACVKTIAFLRQRHRQPAPGGEIEAIIDDYRLARELLVRSFSLAAAEGLSAVLRETIGNIGIDEVVTRTELGERLGKPKSTLCHRVKAALDRELLSEEKSGGKRWLRRNGPLPEERLALPPVAEVEGFFYGVPAPRRSPCFDTFVHDFQELGQEGITAADWAAWVGQPVEVVRERLEALVQAGTLGHDGTTDRYAVRVVTRDLSA